MKELCDAVHERDSRPSRFHQLFMAIWNRQKTKPKKKILDGELKDKPYLLQPQDISTIAAALDDMGPYGMPSPMPLSAS